MKVIDSCIWIALLNEEDSCHEKAKDIFTDIKTHHIFLPDYIYLEILTVLRLRVSDDACKKFISFLQYYEIDVQCNSQEYIKVSTLNFFQHNKLSFIDSFLLSLAEQKEYTVLTFDKNLKKALTE